MDNRPDEEENIAQPESDTQAAPEPETEQERAHRSREEALAEVRQSLREDAEKKKTGFFAVLRDKLRRKKPDEPVESPPEELAQAAEEEWLPKIFAQPEPPAEVPAEPEPPEENLQEFEELEPPAAPAAETTIEETTAGMPAWASLPEEVPAENEQVQPGTRPSVLSTLHGADQAEAGEISDIRQEALEDYAVEPEEPVQAPEMSLSGTARRTWRDMRPFEKSILLGTVIVIAVAMLTGGGFLAVRAIVPVTPPTPTPSNLPYPLSIDIPGGLAFPLRKGAVQDGEWNPAGAEWLEGTEICRWVSIPWSVQMEAVLRTLKSDDEIELAMSNSDHLIYKVKSIQQVAVGQIDSLAPDGPCLLLILAKQDSDTRWVVTALP